MLYQVSGLDHSLLNKLAVHSTLEAAKAITVSHQGFLYVAETDDRKINRIQQVTTNGKISVVAEAPSDSDCKIDPTCDCFSGEWNIKTHEPGENTWTLDTIIDKNIQDCIQKCFKIYIVI